MTRRNSVGLGAGVLVLWLWAAVAQAQAPGVSVSRPELTAAQEQRYQQGFRYYQARQYAQAIETYTALARDNPHGGVLGMVVASYASTAPSPERAQAAVVDADAHRDDMLKQFIAGVLSHYAAHVSARSMEAKRPLYEQAIRYLERTRPAYDFEPRVFIYLAVSHFRLGHQQLAEQFVERAVVLAREDPDAYYCRAEIFQRVNVQRSIADINTYLRMDAVNAARGAVGDPGKVARVRAMRDHLIAVSEGRADPQELFDPVHQPNLEAGPHPPPPGAAPTRGYHPSRRSPRAYGLGLFGVALAVWLSVRVAPGLWRKYRRAPRDP